MAFPLIDSQRLMDRHAAMATVGATGRGGVNRQALTAEELEGRSLLIGWAQARGFACVADAVGNLFVRRPGRDDAEPVLTGSHLDSQPMGGNYDGVFGVLAGLELLETLEDHAIVTRRPVELVNWTNEEGARFQPATMGSAVFAGALPLAEALAAADHDAITMADALAAMWRASPSLVRRGDAPAFHAYIEAHIEQGPVLEQMDAEIGVVTGIQGLRAFAVESHGAEGHAGTVPMVGRRDAFVAAVDLVAEIRRAAHDPEDVLRMTIGQFRVSPGSPNTIPAHVCFTVDLRHPDHGRLTATGDRILDVCRRYRGTCRVEVRELLFSGPVEFDAAIRERIARHAAARGFTHFALPSGATHDAKFMAGRCPTGMIFVPCRGGVSHSESEEASATHLIAGAQVLSDTVIELADHG